jgi:hypothetical protein
VKYRHLAGFFGALVVVVLTWAIAIPRFASPDETAHVYKAYGTAHGDLLGAPAPGFPANLREFDGPDSLGPPNLPCFNGHPEVPASCATESDPRLISSAARYPPWYYGLVGIPARLVGQADRVMAYRWFSLLCCVALVALAMWLVKRSSRRDVAPLVLVALTPMTLFLMASVNPNSAEIAGFVAIWACLGRVASDDECPDRLLVLGACLAAVVVLMRPISVVWLAGTAAVALIAMRPARRRDVLTIRRLAMVGAPMAVAAAGSVLWLRYARFEVDDPRMNRSLSLAATLRESVGAWPDYFRQAIGVLGWLDTELPLFAYVAWTIALGLVAVVHLRWATTRQSVALAALVAIWLALPLAINAFTSSRAGLTYLGRYSLPVFAGVAFLPMWTNRRQGWMSQRLLMAVVVGLVVIAEVGGFWQMLRRFAVGANGKIMLTGSLPWQPAIAPMLLIGVNAAAMIALVWSAWVPWGQVEAAPGERDRQGAEHGPN